MIKTAFFPSMNAIKNQLTNNMQLLGFPTRCFRSDI